MSEAVDVDAGEGEMNERGNDVVARIGTGRFVVVKIDASGSRRDGKARGGLVLSNSGFMGGGLGSTYCRRPVSEACVRGSMDELAIGRRARRANGLKRSSSAGPGFSPAR